MSDWVLFLSSKFTNQVYAQLVLEYISNGGDFKMSEGERPQINCLWSLLSTMNKWNQGGRLLKKTSCEKAHLAISETPLSFWAIHYDSRLFVQCRRQKNQNVSKRQTLNLPLVPAAGITPLFFVFFKNSIHSDENSDRIQDKTWKWLTSDIVFI